jgi:nitroreductase
VTAGAEDPSTGDTVPFSALILDEGDDRLDTVRRDPATLVIDEVAGQLAQLKLVRGHNPALEEEVPRWAYYPWRRTLVSLLGPRGFRALRLDRNRNKITRIEQDRLADSTIGIVGLSVGHAIAHTLALEGLCGELRLTDFDEIELSNLNRIPATIFDLGVNKAVVAARRISELDPYLKVVVVTDGLQAGNIDEFFDGLDVVVEECDSLDMKLVVREAARHRSIPVIMETSDRGLIDVERYDLEPSRKFFHGLLGDTRAEDLVGLSTHDKVPYVMAIIEPDGLSSRMAASMAEIDQTVSTWPQLGGDVALGGATVAATVLRILRGDPVASGRARVDLEAVIEGLQEPTIPDETVTDTGLFEPQPPSDPEDAVAYLAGLAPSGGNVQPWQFSIAGSRLTIEVAPERTSLMDVGFRGSYVACGAALYNAQVAAAHFGILGPATICAGEDSLAVASLELRPGTDADLAADYELALSRCTNRTPAQSGPVDRAVFDALSQAVDSQGGRLHVIEDVEARRKLADVLAGSDRIRYLSPDLHREMMSELRWPATDDLEIGLDVRTLSLDASDLAKLSVARREDVMARLAEWDGGVALGESTHDRVTEAAALLVITTEGVAPADFVRGGLALQRCWLTAEAHGLGLQPISPVFLFAVDDEDIARTVPERYRALLGDLRDRLRSQVGLEPSETLVMILRATAVSRPEVRSRRLPLDKVLHRPV